MRYISLFLFISITKLFGDVFDGMTLYSPTQAGSANGSFYSYLVDNDMNIINSWSHPRGAASMPYLLRDSTLIYPYKVANPTMNSGGVGGGISKYTWDGELIWNYQVSNQTYQHHHDVEPLPNGNILIIAWEKKTASEAYAVGRESIDNSLNVMWSEAILELEPVGTGDANIVWEWHIWDHLIQDVDPDLPNYGVIADHPELQDINYGNAGGNGGPGGANGDWKHFNAVAYNEDLDQIALSSRHHDEIYIIDHSTTTEEAAGHTGGNSGMGGDFLYRWGNPQNYNRGNNSDQILDDQHGVNWIPQGYPGEGNLILFNNRHSGNNSSAALEFITPINDNGTYNISGNNPYGPNTYTWIHQGGFHSDVQSGAFRQPNGNTLISDANSSYVFEVTYDGEIVWELNAGNNVMIPRAQKYGYDYFDNDILLGDLNNDQIINVLDIISTVNIVLGVDSYNPSGDMNQDGIINVLDIVSLVSIILGS